MVQCSVICAFDCCSLKLLRGAGCVRRRKVEGLSKELRDYRFVV